MESALKRDYTHALHMQDRLTPLHAAIFVEPGVCGTKYALSVLGRGRNEMRLPLTPVGEARALATGIEAALDQVVDRRLLMARGLNYTAESAATKFLEIVADLPLHPRPADRPIAATSAP